MYTWIWKEGNCYVTTKESASHYHDQYLGESTTGGKFSLEWWNAFHLTKSSHITKPRFLDGWHCKKNKNEVGPGGIPGLFNQCVSSGHQDHVHGFPYWEGKTIKQGE